MSRTRLGIDILVESAWRREDFHLGSQYTAQRTCPRQLFGNYTRSIRAA